MPVEAQESWSRRPDRASVPEPSPRGEFVEPALRRLRDAAEHIGDPGPRVDEAVALDDGDVDLDAANRAEAARCVPRAALTLHALGARLLPQALKDDLRIVRLMFRCALLAELPVLRDAAAACLDRRHAACRAAIQATCKPLGDRLWLVRALCGH